MRERQTSDGKETQGSEVEVAVIGLGPVGITLCSLLAQQGIKVIGVDAAEEIYPLPRAIGMDHEVLRVFQQIGLAQGLQEDIGAYRASEYRAEDGRLLRRLESPPEPWPLAWPPYVTFVQPRVEARLRRHAEAAGIPLRLGVELTAIQEPQAPLLTLRDRRSGTEETLAARYVIGCDGGGSFVRRTLGISFEDLEFDEPWLVVDVLLDDEDLDLPKTNVQFCHPSRPHTFVVGPGNLRRWEFMILPGEEAEALNREARLWELLSPWLKPGQARIWRSAAYRFHALVAQEWRRDAVLLAGDAAHMTPPFLAQGMVQGVKDAANLAWKLAGVLRRGWPETVLDSFEAERRPLVREVISITKGLGRIICERDPVAAATRDAQMTAELAADPRPRVRQDLFPPLSAGMLARGADGTLQAGVGASAPQPLLCVGAEVRRMDDHIGLGFHLLISSDLSLSGDLRQAAEEMEIGIHRLGVDAVERDGLISEWLQRHGAKAVLLRPDRMIFGHAADETELRDLLQQLKGWLAPAPS